MSLPLRIDIYILTYVQRAGEGLKANSWTHIFVILSKHSHSHLTNDQCKFFLFSHDPISRDFKSFLGTFIKDQKIANYFSDMGDFYVYNERVNY